MNNRKDTSADQKCPEEANDETEQSQKGYYYDDATGYEMYDPESEGDDATDDESS